MKSLITNLGEYIREKRKLYNLTQIELAERSGVGVCFTRELERGKTTIQLDKVNLVLALFGETLKPTEITDSAN
ncbi:MAG: helix-turn-helix transcriptional regulator [Bacteroidaceae bacterium]|nr:helix-turn-helix transcriptional regulator [Bacteroidaceae bacterium]